MTQNALVEYIRMAGCRVTAFTGENVVGGSDSAPVRLALCSLGEERTTVLDDILLQIFIDFPKLAERAKGISLISFSKHPTPGTIPRTR